jgi:hypothetical protein
MKPGLSVAGVPFAVALSLMVNDYGSIGAVGNFPVR